MFVSQLFPCLNRLLSAAVLFSLDLGDTPIRGIQQPEYSGKLSYLTLYPSETLYQEVISSSTLEEVFV